MIFESGVELTLKADDTRSACPRIALGRESYRRDQQRGIKGAPFSEDQPRSFRSSTTCCNCSSLVTNHYLSVAVGEESATLGVDHEVIRDLRVRLRSAKLFGGWTDVLAIHPRIMRLRAPMRWPTRCGAEEHGQ
jgi:hypothetical protein